MDRRLAGLAVLILVVVAAMVVPGLAGRRVAGEAVAKSFPEPPAIGDCAVSIPTRPGGYFGEPSDLDIGSVTWGPCTGPIAGEVVTTAQPAGAPAPDGDNAAERCYLGTASYAGLDVSGSTVTLTGVPPTDLLSWEPIVGASVQQVVPDDEERRAGRSWGVCLVTPLDGGTYHGTLAQGFTAGRVPDEFGVCWNGTDLDAVDAPIDLIPCSRPHSAQLLAIGVAQDRSRVSVDDLKSACRAVATAVMRTDRPVQTGELAVVLDAVTSDGASSRDAPLTVGCFASVGGSRQLGGSVIGLTDRPVPFVS